MLKWLKYTLVCFIFLSTDFSVCAQEPNSTDKIRVPFDVFKENPENAPIASAISTDLFFENPVPKSNNIEAGNTYWVRVDLKELQPRLKKTKWYLKTGKFLEATSYYREGKKIRPTAYGYLNQPEEISAHKSLDGFFFSGENLINSRYLYYKVKFFGSDGVIKNFKPKLMTAEAKLQEKNYYARPEYKTEAMEHVFIGAFLFIFVFSFITYFTSKKLDFLFYSLYTLCLLIYLGKNAFGINEILNNNFTLFTLWLHSILQILINLFYVAFAKYYLETRHNYPKLDKAIYIIAGFLILIIPFETYLSFSLQRDAHLVLMNIHRLVMSVFAILSFIYLLKFAKNKLAYYILIGSFFFTAGSLIMLFTDNKTYMILGSVVEVFLFGLGLSYKMKKSDEEKIQLKQSVYDNQIAAFRAQMNPHFIFNSLSSIQHLISSNKKEAAIKYLSKFSLLMRNLLEGSIEASTLLADEISSLRKYIELEALRFNDAFHYTITLDKNVDPNVIEVPSLIVQPFVENAILHGLLHKEGNDKQLHINFKKEAPYLICEVEDNGIGRKASAENKSILEKQKTSRGIDVTVKRLQIICQSSESPIEIIDKTDESKQPTGTLVIIKIMIE